MGVSDAVFLMNFSMILHNKIKIDQRGLNFGQINNTVLALSRRIWILHPNLIPALNQVLLIDVPVEPKRLF